jgi:OOP family OmpA-OmpF porin
MNLRVVVTTIIVAAFSLLTFAGRPLNAAPASTNANDHRDPNAPCFRWPAVDMDEDGVFDRVDNCVNTPKGCSVDRWGCETDEDHDGVCDGLDRCPGTHVGDRVDADGCSESQHAAAAPPPPEPVSEVERQLVQGGRIRLENIYFETESDHLLPESEASLNEAGRVLEKFPDLRIEVEGHSDTRGKSSYNMRLSQARAEAVRRYLLGHFSLSPDHYRARGYGETQPETQERNEEELLRNRRVVLRVTNPEALPHGVKVINKK